MTAYLLRHLQVFLSTVGQLARSPGSTLLTVCAIGITLAMPTLLYLLVDDIERISKDWEGQPQVSIFLNRDTSDDTARALQTELDEREEIGQSRFIHADDALADFKNHSGLGMALEILSENPLPNSILIHVQSPYDNVSDIEQLVAEIDAKPEVDFAQWDMAWIQRLHLLLDIVERGVVILAALLVLAVLIIISNTIRLAILNRRDEIEIMKLIGATERFIRRPFLYGGALQGLLGALLAAAIVTVCVTLLEGPLGELVILYRGEFNATKIEIDTFGILLAAGSGLGWLAARVAVSRHLRQIEPH